jgi:hypothetical protein
VEASDADDERQSMAMARQACDGPRELADDARRVLAVACGCPSDDRGGNIDTSHVDALGDDRVPRRPAGQVHARQRLKLRGPTGAREQHQLPSAARQSTDEIGPEPESVLRVGRDERTPVERASGLGGGDRAVRVRSEREHDGDAQLPGENGAGKAAGISHAQVQDVRPGTREQRGSDAAGHRDE